MSLEGRLPITTWLRGEKGTIYHKIADHIDTLEARIKELEPDAARYKAIKAMFERELEMFYSEIPNQCWDAEIDARIAAMKDQS